MKENDIQCYFCDMKYSDPERMNVIFLTNKSIKGARWGICSNCVLSAVEQLVNITIEKEK